VTFLAAGHEITVSLVQWALRLLTQHPRYMYTKSSSATRFAPHSPSAHTTYGARDSLPQLRNFTQEGIPFCFDY